MTYEFWSILGALVILFEVMGIISAIQAVLTARTSQGAIAWALALLTIPFIAVPMYWIFGRSKFYGYIKERRTQGTKMGDVVQQVTPHANEFRVHLEDPISDARVLEELTHLPFIRGNEAELLIDGQQTFDAMFSAIDRAKKYVLAEFFIVKDDELGHQFKDHLIAAARRGCAVYLLYDDVGSMRLGREYLAELRNAGVHVTGMKTTKGLFNRFQLNFRNHRKIVVIDGYEALVGGLNVGDEYIHRSKLLTPWRDTHMRMVGPASLAAQLAFVEDWNWATEQVPDLNWQPRRATGADKTMFVLPSGPDDQYETCGLFFTHGINIAKHRIWIASPYFVPDEGIITALQLAAMRGVDVRILIPGLADKWLVKRAAMAYVPWVTEAGVKMYEYGNGFLHQKVALIDDEVSVVGTANLDNRSFRLNFEISVLTIDRAFATEVETMLERDFSNSTLIDPDEVANRGAYFHVSSRIARLFSPVL